MKKFKIELNLSGTWEAVDERLLSAETADHAVAKAVSLAAKYGAKYVAGFNIRAVEV